MYPCRQQIGADLDEVATGAARNRLLQRLKLNNQVALVTGAPRLSWRFVCSEFCS